MTKDAPYQRISFVAGPFSNLGHRERLAKRIEHAVDVLLTPCAPFRCGSTVAVVWQPLDSAIHRGDVFAQLRPLAPPCVLVTQDFCSHILGVQDEGAALGFGLESFALNRSQSFLFAPAVGVIGPSLDVPKNPR